MSHLHAWVYLHPTKRICEDEDCPVVEVLTDAGDWVPTWEEDEE